MPVEPTTLAAFVAAVAALVVSPGPDSLLILRYTLSSGHRVGLATVAGVQLGLVGHTALAALGVSVLIAASPVLFRGVAVAGALYLGWLGIQGLHPRGLVRLEAGPGAVSARRACRDAFLTNLSNPKVVLLFLALLPNFVDPARGRVPLQLAFLGATLIAVNTLWQVPLAGAAEWIRRRLADPRQQRALSVATGVVLLGFAAGLLWEQLAP